MAKTPASIPISQGAGRNMSVFGLATSRDRQTVIIGDAERTGETDVAELSAHDANDRGSPLKIGGRASASPFTAVADGQRTDAWFTPQGQLGVVNAASPRYVYEGGLCTLTHFQGTYVPLTDAIAVPGSADFITNVLGVSATMSSGGAGVLDLTDGTNVLFVIGYFPGPSTISVSIGRYAIAKTPINTGLHVRWTGAAANFMVSLLYYQA